LTPAKISGLGGRFCEIWLEASSFINDVMLFEFTGCFECGERRKKYFVSPMTNHYAFLKKM
jgi:hypothetical protein